MREADRARSGREKRSSLPKTRLFPGTGPPRFQRKEISHMSPQPVNVSSSSKMPLLIVCSHPHHHRNNVFLGHSYLHFLFLFSFFFSNSRAMSIQAIQVKYLTRDNNQQEVY